ncbi:hypothetical protein FOZ62_001212 [Perkinsus olseni]|uniref:Uncharacterized protein n=1 Tax=Perkinsus olseni TaxID=32597 RepID=A0A7J6RL74_PEROL|nr:hypothetical protein FOZ62_001212 [Perkinsus olseni]
MRSVNAAAAAASSSSSSSTQGEGSVSNGDMLSRGWMSDEVGNRSSANSLAVPPSNAHRRIPKQSTIDQQQQQQQAHFPEEFPNGLFDGFDEIVSTNSTSSLANATVGSNMPTVSLREVRQHQQQQQQPTSRQPSFMTDAVRGWDNFLTRRNTRVSSASSSSDSYEEGSAQRSHHRQRSFYNLLPSGSNRSCVPNSCYSPTLGLTIGCDEPTVVRQAQQEPRPVAEDELSDSSSADIPTSEWDSYMDYVTCTESDREDSNEQRLTSAQQKGGWRQCLAWVAKAGAHRPRRRRRKQVRCLRKPDTHTRRIRKILRALSLATEFDPHIYSDARLAQFFVVVLLHTEYHNFSNSADIINLPPSLRRPRRPPPSKQDRGSSSSSIEGECSPSSSTSDDTVNEDWQALGFSEREFESLGRDLNRPGSCMFSLLLMIFFAVEENEAADVVVKVIRNVSVSPPELFGLFAVNAAKWVRDICRRVNTNQRVSELFHGVGEEWYRQRNLDFDAVITWWLHSSATKVTPGFPKDIEKKFIRVRRGRRDIYGYEVLADDNDGIAASSSSPQEGEQLLDYPLGSSSNIISSSFTRGGLKWSRSAGTGEAGDDTTLYNGAIDTADVTAPERLVSIHKSRSTGTSSYWRAASSAAVTRRLSTADKFPSMRGSSADSIPEEGPSASTAMVSSSSSSSCRGTIVPDRVPSCHNIILWSDVLVAAGSLYAYTMISFAKFWLEQDMVNASGEDANKKLNNEFINQHFVSKLTVPRGGIRGIAARTAKVLGRVKELYQKLQDEQLRKLSMASRLSERSSDSDAGLVSAEGGKASRQFKISSTRNQGGAASRGGSSKSLASSATEPHLHATQYGSDVERWNGNSSSKKQQPPPMRKSAPGNLACRNSSSSCSGAALPLTIHQPLSSQTGGTGAGLLDNSRSF